MVPAVLTGIMDHEPTRTELERQLSRPIPLPPARVFQLQEGRHWFEFPYFVVQTLPIGRLPQERLKAGDPGLLAEALGVTGSSVDDSASDIGTGILWVKTSERAGDGTEIKVLTALIPADRGLIRFSFFARPQTYARLEPQFAEIANSVRVTPRASPGATQRPGPTPGHVQRLLASDEYKQLPYEDQRELFIEAAGLDGPEWSQLDQQGQEELIEEFVGAPPASSSPGVAAQSPSVPASRSTHTQRLLASDAFKRLPYEDRRELFLEAAVLDDPDWPKLDPQSQEELIEEFIGKPPSSEAIESTRPLQPVSGRQASSHLSGGVLVGLSLVVGVIASAALFFSSRLRESERLPSTTGRRAWPWRAPHKRLEVSESPEPPQRTRDEVDVESSQPLGCKVCGLTIPPGSTNCVCGASLALGPVWDQGKAVAARQPVIGSAPTHPRLRWLKFWTWVWLPINGVLTLMAAVAAPGNLVLWVAGLLMFVTAVGLNRRRAWGWVLNWFVVAATGVMGALVYITESQPPTEGLPGSAVILVGWFVPNYLYWKRRKVVFLTSGEASSYAEQMPRIPPRALPERPELKTASLDARAGASAATGDGASDRLPSPQEPMRSGPGEGTRTGTEPEQHRGQAMAPRDGVGAPASTHGRPLWFLSWFNQRQRLAIALGILALVVMLVMPPWQRTLGPDATHVRPAGYHFIGTPPQLTIGVRLDYGRLALQALVVSLLTGLAVAVLAPRNEE